MVLLLTSWLIIYLISSVLGFGLFKLAKHELVNSVSQAEIILVGLIGIIIILQLFSIFIPTDFRLTGLLLLGSIAINWWLKNIPLQTAIANLRRNSAQPVLYVLIGTVMLFSIIKPGLFDSGLYHIPAIHWYERFPVIPGLGNLHGRLAFNSSFFLASAAFGFSALAGQTLYALNGFMLIIFGAYIIKQIRSESNIHGLKIVQTLTLLLTLYYLLYTISSPSPDIWATILPLFIFFFWLNRTSEASWEQFYLSIALIFLCLTVKLGTVPMLLFIPILFFTHRRRIGYKQIIITTVISGLIIVPWLARNVILSGYLLYPFPAIDLFSVDWKIPMSAVHLEENYVTFWSRFHIGEGEPGFNMTKIAWPITRWFPIWWHDQNSPATLHYYTLNTPLFLVACLSPLLLVFQGIRYGLHPVRLWMAYIVASIGFIFWFYKAPEFRFGYVFLWMTVLLPLIPLVERLSLPSISRGAVWFLGLAMVYFSAKLIYQKHPITTRSLVFPTWYGYREAEAIDAVYYHPRNTHSGLQVLIPEKSTLDQRCYEIDAPCSPYFFDDLQQRGSTIEAGFRR